MKIDRKLPGKLRLLAMVGIAGTLAFSILNLNSVFIMLLALAWLLDGNFREKWKLLRRDMLFLSFALYFLVLLAGAFSADSIAREGKYLESMIGLVVLPLLLCSMPVSPRERNTTFLSFLLLLTIASLFCLVMAGISYLHQKNINVFFYHDLLKPIHHHAIYFSVFLMSCMVFLIRHGDEFSYLNSRKWLKWTWLAYCVLVLVLLSSKLVLILFLIYFLFRINRTLRLSFWQKTMTLLLAIGIILSLFMFNNPIKERFADAIKLNINIEDPKFNTATYFSGVEFRLLLWRITYEILHETKAWLMGVGATHAQDYLNQKYRQLGLYTGGAGQSWGGYMKYNCHNQFLQSSLQSGMIGLTALFFICVMLVKRAMQVNDEVFTTLILLTLCFFIIESVLERQYGILLCTWLPLLFARSWSKKEEIIHTTS